MSSTEGVLIEKDGTRKAISLKWFGAALVTR